MSINTDYAQYSSFGSLIRENILSEVKISPKFNENHLESLQKSETEGICSQSDQMIPTIDKK